ncbi:boudin [Carabus blaptoides fortunei]
MEKPASETDVSLLTAGSLELNTYLSSLYSVWLLLCSVYKNKVILSVTVLLLLVQTAYSINCYQCIGTDSNTPFQCNEFLEDVDIQPDSCESVYGAQYCIKHVGRFEGGIGTKRYCSPLDLGNYCDYVKQPGDKLEYRSCVYTCTGDGCNSSSSLRPVTFWSFLTIFIVLFYKTQFLRIR